MGLDMYLKATTYVSGYSFRGEENVSEYNELVKLFGVEENVAEHTPSAGVEFTIGYWRKANHIHQWFVDNVQGGEDECRPHDVSRDQLRELREACLRILALETKSATVSESVLQAGGEIAEEKRKVKVLTARGSREAEKLLPTQEGFFFGGTGYDQWYLQDVQDTVDQIDRALEMPDRWYFEYQSSW